MADKGFWQAGFLEKEEFTDRAAEVDQRIAELAADLETIEKEQASRGGVSSRGSRSSHAPSRIAPTG